MSIKSVILALVIATYFSGFAAAETILLERQGGVYIVPVQINGMITLQFILDSGASDVTIPEDVFSTLKRTGTVGDNDFLGTRSYRVADGRTLTNKVFILRQVRVGRQIVKNVMANVMDVTGEPLLGQAFLSQLPPYIIDNERNALVIHDACPPVPPPVFDDRGHLIPPPPC
jgi:predicted aspartyl protease